MSVLIIAAAVFFAVLLFALPHQAGEISEEHERPSLTDLRRQRRDDNLQAAYAALDRGDTDTALRLWQTAGGSAVEFWTMVREEGKG